MLEVLIILGQQCAPDASWAAVFEANMMDCLGEGVSFYYPPHVEEQGIRCWHPYTHRHGEEYVRTHHAAGYHKYIEFTAAEVWKKLAQLEDAKAPFEVVAISNGGAVGFELALSKLCTKVLFVSSVPVASQQRRAEEVSCPIGFLHGTGDIRLFGGHAAVEEVADEMHATWCEFEGGHDGFSEKSVAEALNKLDCFDINAAECLRLGWSPEDPQTIEW